MSIQDIKDILEAGGLSKGQLNFIDKGTLKNKDGNDVEYGIHLGWDIVLAHECNNKWKEYQFQLYEHIDQNISDEDEQKRVLNSIQTEGDHWDWVTKSCLFTSDNYKWFFLIVENSVEGICIVYHPKDSAIDGADIFYIEFIATAPWNRQSLVNEKELSGIGSCLVKSALKYAVNDLGLTCGFSLHSLPQACGYYKKIGMENHTANNKGILEYFEMPREASKKMLLCQ